MANLVAITTAINRQDPVAAVLSWEAVQPVPPTGHKEKQVLDSAVSAALVKLRKNARNALVTLSRAMKDQCHIYAGTFVR